MVCMYIYLRMVIQHYIILFFLEYRIISALNEAQELNI